MATSITIPDERLTGSLAPTSVELNVSTLLVNDLSTSIRFMKPLKYLPKTCVYLEVGLTEKHNSYESANPNRISSLLVYFSFHQLLGFQTLYWQVCRFFRDRHSSFCFG